MKIDPHSHVPIFLQIVEQVGRGIAAGVFRPGESLPAQRTLAVSLGVNPNTVQKALDELERRGLVASRRGVGMFVTDRGAASAQNDTEAAVADAFGRAVTAAREARLSTTRIREIFEKALRQASGKSKETQ